MSNLPVPLKCSVGGQFGSQRIWSGAVDACRV
jgi:hypothetical protein